MFESTPTIYKNCPCVNDENPAYGDHTNCGTQFVEQLWDAADILAEMEVQEFKLMNVLMANKY